MYTLDRQRKQENYELQCLYNVPKYNIDVKRRFVKSSNKNLERYFSNEWRKELKSKKRKRVYCGPKKLQVCDVARDEKFIPLDDVGENESTNEYEDFDQMILRESREWNKKCNEKQLDEKVWLEFVQFQEKVLHVYGHSEQLVRQVLEKQKLILEKAIQIVPEHVGLKIILVRMQMLLNSNDQVNVLQNATAKMPKNTVLWDMYIQRSLQDFKQFSLSTMKTLFSSSIEHFSVEQSSTLVFDTSSVLNKTMENTECVLKYVCLFMDMLQHAGNAEYSVALAQALISINMEMPSSIQHKSWSRKKKLFELYWDDECERLGEGLNTPWNVWYAKEHSLQDAVPFAAGPFQNIQPRQKNHALLLPDANKYIFNPDEFLKNYQPAVEEVRSTTNDTENIFEYRDEETQGYMYSNLHGYRIALQDTNDAMAYQKVLNELKGKDDDESVNKQKTAQLEQQRSCGLSKDELQKDALLAWLQAEDTMCLQQWQPLRMTESAYEALIEEQPDRVILFEDLKPFLCELDDVSTKAVVFHLLKLLGVTFTHQTDVEYYNYTDHIAGALEMLGQPLLDSIFSSSAQLSGSFHLDTKATQTLLAKLTEHQAHVTHLLSIDAEKLKFCDTVLQQCVHQCPQIVDYQLALIDFYAATQSAAEGKKLAMILLQSSKIGQYDLRLWNAYACMEKSFGNLREATKILNKALTLTTKLAPEHQVFGHHLLFTWSRFAYYEEQREVSYISYILSMGPIQTGEESLLNLKKRAAKSKQPLHTVLGELLTPAFILRVCSKYESQIEQCSKLEEYPVLVHNYALFRYLSSGCIDANTVYEKYIKQKPSAKLFALYLELLHHHQIALISAPQTIRSVVYQAVEHFPQHPLFLRLFINVESRFVMSQRIRIYFQQLAQHRHESFDTPSCIDWIFLVVSEVCRASTMTDDWDKVSLERIQKVLDQSVESMKGQSCVLLWRLKFRLEFRRGCIDLAKKSYYRALYRCPWSKLLFLDSIRLFRAYFTREEIRSILEIAIAKDITLKNDTVHF